MPRGEANQNGIPPEIKEIADDRSDEQSQSIHPWLLPEIEAYYNPPPRNPLPLSLLPVWPYGHRCGICRDLFRSKKARHPYCVSCGMIVADLTKELEQIVTERLDSGMADVRKLLDAVLARCTCDVCNWQMNANRMLPRDLPSLLEYLPGWAERYVQHYMHHVFSNRFLYNRRFGRSLTEQVAEFLAHVRPQDSRVRDGVGSMPLGAKHARGRRPRRGAVEGKSGE